MIGIYYLIFPANKLTAADYVQSVCVCVCTLCVCVCV